MLSFSTFFEDVAYTPPDAIFELTKDYKADPDTRKVNLGQGKDKNNYGNPWILPAVKAVKEAIKNCEHEYLPTLGHPKFRKLVTELVFKMDSTAIRESRCTQSKWLGSTAEQWTKIGALMKERRLSSLFDAVYLGLTSGNYDEDAYAIRYFAEELNLEMGVCISFAKSMGIYGERAGLCAFVSRNHSIATNVESNLAQLIRGEISNPPAFGARIFATVLEDGGLFSQWQRDLATMSSGITGIRKRLFGELTALGIANSHSFQHTVSPGTIFLPGTPGDGKKLTQQKGMF
ncbi:aspartate aminotransferase [Aspergillus niger]|nr:aspartate aminotransferase [Aspergillus niger]